MPRTLLARIAPPLFCLAVAVAISLLPPPEGLTSTAMHLLAVFVAVILSLLLTDLPISIVSAIGMAVLAHSRSLACTALDGQLIPDCSQCTRDRCGNVSESAFKTALSGFADEVNWLVFAAFHIGKAVEKTGLGRRIALVLVRYFGRSLLGLGYAVFVSEILLAPLVPSNTARGGGILLPIVLSIIRTLGSSPAQQPRRRGGEFLILCGAHANLLSASLFQTGMAANPLVSKYAKDVFGISFSYLHWLAGSVVPGLIAMLILPWCLYQFSAGRLLRRRKHQRSRSISSLSSISSSSCTAVPRPHEPALQPFLTKQDTRGMPCEEPTLTAVSIRHCRTASSEETAEIMQESLETSLNLDHVRESVLEELCSLGRLSLEEGKLIFILLICLALWLSNGYTGLNTSVVAFSAVVVMLCVNVVTWDDVVGNKKAWDTLFWLGILIMMANQLKILGVSKYLGERVAIMVEAAGMGAVGSAWTLGILYFFSMYIFSSLTGHIVAFVGPFLSAGKTLGTPPWMMTALMAYFSTLCGCLTNFSSGPVVIYFAEEFASRKRWFQAGLGMAIGYLGIYSTLGLLWWKVLGWW